MDRTRDPQTNPQKAVKHRLQRTTAQQLAAALCAQLATLTPKLKPAQKTALLTAYRQGVTPLAAAGWLTSQQAATLRTLTDSL
jgi:hypothetical protein